MPGFHKICFRLYFVHYLIILCLKSHGNAVWLYCRSHFTRWWTGAIIDFSANQPQATCCRWNVSKSIVAHGQRSILRYAPTTTDGFWIPPTIFRRSNIISFIFQGSSKIREPRDSWWSLKANHKVAEDLNWIYRCGNLLVNSKRWSFRFKRIGKKLIDGLTEECNGCPLACNNGEYALIANSD